MNALDRNLKKGDKLVLSDGEEVVISNEKGFGLHTYVQGIDISVRYKGKRKDETINALEDIDEEETLKRFSKENGWTEPAEKL